MTATDPAAARWGPEERADLARRLAELPADETCGVLASTLLHSSLLLERATAERDAALAALARIEDGDGITAGEERTALAVWAAEGRPRTPGTYDTEQIIAAAARHHNGGKDHE